MGSNMCSENNGGGGVVRTGGMTSLIFRRFEGRPGHSLNIIAFDRTRRGTISTTVHRGQLRDPYFSGFFVRSERRPFFVGGLRGMRNSRESAVVFDVNCTGSGGNVVCVGFNPLDHRNNCHHLGITVAETGRGIGLMNSVMTASVSLSGMSSRNIGVLHSCVRFTRRKVITLRGRLLFGCSLRFSSPFRRTMCSFLRSGNCGMMARINYSKFHVSVTIGRPARGKGFTVNVRYSKTACRDSHATHRQSELHRTMLRSVN